MEFTSAEVMGGLKEVICRQGLHLKLEGMRDGEDPSFAVHTLHFEHLERRCISTRIEKTSKISVLDNRLHNTFASLDGPVLWRETISSLQNRSEQLTGIWRPSSCVDEWAAPSL